MGGKNEGLSPTPDMNRNRLPTLFEVLSRRTAAPVDLFFFYIYMRDQQRSVDYLDFWLDVAQHMSLCRHYVRELRRSVLISTPEFDFSLSKRSSSVRENPENKNAGISISSTEREREREQDAQTSSFLREATSSDDVVVESQPSSTNPHINQIRPTTSEQTISRADIRQSAEKILYTFLLRGAEREIFLPDPIVEEITKFIEEDGRDDPEVFDAAKDYVFQAMERDAFPGFLRSKALGNLVPPSLTLRLIFGLFCIFVALWIGLTFIFLDFPRRSRAWLSIPCTFGVYNLMAHQYRLDPLVALVGFSEYTLMKFSRLRDPYVRRLLKRRAITVLLTATILDTGLIILFLFIPGKHL